MRRYRLGSHYVICDLCGFKVRANETIMVNDKYNTLNNMVVCKKHNEKSNPGLWPDRLYERPLRYDEKIRPRQPDSYITNEFADDILPSAPKNLSGQISGLSGGMYLTWDAPDYLGSGRLLGYKITRVVPQLGYPATLEDTTIGATAYLDTEFDINLSYSYKVAAITEAGVGPLSEPFYYPKYEFAGILPLFITDSQQHRTLVANGKFLTQKVTIQ